MGKKSSSNGGGGEKKEGGKARAFALKVANRCDCKGCAEKIRKAINDLMLLQGVEKVDRTALDSKGEVKLVATADPEKLRQRFHKATGKNVELLLPKDKDQPHAAARPAAPAPATALNLPAPYAQGGWANHQLAGGWTYGLGAAAPAPQPRPYPWAVQPEAVAWGPYAYPPAHGQCLGQGGYGYGGAWHTHGY